MVRMGFPSWTQAVIIKGYYHSTFYLKMNKLSHFKILGICKESLGISKVLMLVLNF